MSRDPFFDNAKLTLMILVVVGHAIEPLVGASRAVETGYLWIYAFHMPVFAAIAGVFAKTGRERGRVRALLLRLGAPYLVFQMGLLAVDLLDGTSTQNPLVTPYWPLWFLFSLLVWSLALPHVARLRFALAVSVVVAIGAGYVPQLDRGFSASRTLAMFPFFLGGHLLGRDGVQRLLRSVTRTQATLALGVLGLAAFVVAPRVDHRWLHGAEPYGRLGAPTAGGVVRLTIMALACVAGVAFLRLVPTLAGRWTAFGSRTLYAYLLHGVFLRGFIVAGVYEMGDATVVAVVAAVLAAPGALLLMSASVARFARPFVEPGRVARAPALA